MSGQYLKKLKREKTYETQDKNNGVMCGISAEYWKHEMPSKYE